MKYIVRKGTATFDKLTEVNRRMNESRECVKQLVTELGGEEWLVGGFDYVAGSLKGVRFKERPEGWKQVEPNRYFNCFFPKSTKANKELLERIAALPKVKKDELNGCVGFKQQMVDLTYYSCIGMSWGEDFHLIHIAEETEYSPTADMEELLESEYQRLKKELQEARKEVAA